MTEKKVIEKIIAWEKNEVGYKEEGVNLNKYAEHLDKFDTFFIPINGYAWCAVFQIDGFVTCFGYNVAKDMLQFDNHSCSCSAWAARMETAGMKVSFPMVGDIWMNKSKSHVGLVTDILMQENGVYIVAGNTSDEVKHYMPTESIGNSFFYRPRYDRAVTDDTELAKDWAIAYEIFIGDGNGEFRWKEPITREEVAIVLHRLANM